MPRTSTKAKTPIKAKKTIKKVAEEVKIEATPKSAFSITGALAIVVVLVLFGLGAHLASNYAPKSATTTNPQVQSTQTIAHNGQDGKTALELLKNRADVKSQDYESGTYVQAINGTENNETHIWLFYINGQMSFEDVGKLQTKNSDKIEWRYEQIY